jgi:hypothetical protein
MVGTTGFEPVDPRLNSIGYKAGGKIMAKFRINSGGFAISDLVNEVGGREDIFGIGLVMRIFRM